MTTRSRLVLTLFLALVTGCNPKHPQPADSPGERVFEARGVVRDIAPSRRTAVIRHEEIPRYMPKMVMELTVRDTNDLAGINVGDEITFHLHATEDTHWIDTIHRLRTGSP